MTRRLLVAIAAMLVGAAAVSGRGARVSAASPDTLTIARVPDPQLGLSCSIQTTDVIFGSYSVFAGSPTDATGSVKYSCTLGVFVRVTLDKGSAPSFDPRTMKNASNEVLNYNLFLDGGHGTIWEDSGTNQIQETLIALLPKTRTIFGRIPAGQDVTVGGPYTDHVTATIVF